MSNHYCIGSPCKICFPDPIFPMPTAQSPYIPYIKLDEDNAKVTEFKRKVILSWHNLMDTAEYVANHFDITFPSDCKSRPGYVLDEMLEIVNTISRQDNPTNIGNLGYIAVPHINSDNDLVITFYVDVAANNDYQKMEYLGGREMRIRL